MLTKIWRIMRGLLSEAIPSDKQSSQASCRAPWAEIGQRSAINFLSKEKPSVANGGHGLMPPAVSSDAATTPSPNFPTIIPLLLMATLWWQISGRKKYINYFKKGQIFLALELLSQYILSDFHSRIQIFFTFLFRIKDSQCGWEPRVGAWLRGCSNYLDSFVFILLFFSHHPRIVIISRLRNATINFVWWYQKLPFLESVWASEAVNSLLIKGTSQ